MLAVSFGRKASCSKRKKQTTLRHGGHVRLGAMLRTKFVLSSQVGTTERTNTSTIAKGIQIISRLPVYYIPLPLVPRLLRVYVSKVAAEYYPTYRINGIKQINK